LPRNETFVVGATSKTVTTYTLNAEIARVAFVLRILSVQFPNVVAETRRI